MFFATHRAAYAAERSTFDGSLPLNAPPPWRAMPPYVSTMILRPVRPASPWGPPTLRISDILATGGPRVSVGPADDEAAGWVDQEFGSAEIEAGLFEHRL